jgi:hypothetical protein
MLAFALDHNHSGNRLFLVTLLNHEIRIDLTPLVPLD